MLMQLAVEAAAANGYVLVRKRKRKSGACRRKDKRVREEEKREEEKRARGTLVVWEPLPDVALGALPDVVAHDAVEGAPLVVIEGPAVAVNGPTNAEQVNNPGLLLYQLETINRFRIHIPVQVPFDIRIPVQVVVGAGGGGGDGDGDAVQGGIEPHNLLLLNQPVVDVPVQNDEAAVVQDRNVVGNGDGDGDAVQGGIEPHNLLLLNQQPVVDVPIQNVEAAVVQDRNVVAPRVIADGEEIIVDGEEIIVDEQQGDVLVNEEVIVDARVIADGEEIIVDEQQGDVIVDEEVIVDEQEDDDEEEEEEYITDFDTTTNDVRFSEIQVYRNTVFTTILDNIKNEHYLNKKENSLIAVTDRQLVIFTNQVYEITKGAGMRFLIAVAEILGVTNFVTMAEEDIMPRIEVALREVFFSDDNDVPVQNVEAAVVQDRNVVGGGDGDGDGDAVQGGIEPHNLLLLNQQPVVDVPVQNVEAVDEQHGDVIVDREEEEEEEEEEFNADDDVELIVVGHTTPVAIRTASVVTPDNNGDNEVDGVNNDDEVNEIAIVNVEDLVSEQDVLGFKSVCEAIKQTVGSNVIVEAADFGKFHKDNGSDDLSFTPL